MLGWFPSGMRLTPNSSQPMVKIISYLWYAIINLASDCHQLEKLIYEMTLAIAIGAGMRDQYVEENHTTAINWLLENMPETNSGLSFISRFFQMLPH